MEQKTFFSKKSVMEVSKGQAVKDGWATGCIFMKAFPLEKGGRDKQIALKIIPEEAWGIARTIKFMLAGKIEKQEVAYHAHPEGKTAASLSLATKSHEGKKFRLLYFNRKWKNAKKDDKGESISFPMKDEDFSFLAAILEKFALESCYNRKAEEKVEDDLPNTSDSPDETPASDTGDEITEDYEDDIPF